MSAEEWRPVPDFPDYFATSAGRVVSCHRRWKQPRELKGGFTHNGRGYRTVLLVNTDGATTRTLHSVIAEAFHGSRPEGMQVRHLNGDRLDNRPANLAWGTASENSLDTIAHGTHPNASKVQCVHGHEFDEANTYVDRLGRRHCRACRCLRSRALRAARALRLAETSTAA
jgi:hypothetical protein